MGGAMGGLIGEGSGVEGAPEAAQGGGAGADSAIPVSAAEAGSA